LSWYDFGALADGGEDGRAQFLRSMQQSLDVIDHACAAEGPFDGLFAFSQGASLAALVMALGELRERGVAVPEDVPIALGAHTTFRFAAMVAGFLPGEGRTRAYVPEVDAGAPLRSVFEAASPVRNAAFVMYGASDRVIPAERSERLARMFASPVVTTHDGGHHVPSSSVIRKAFRGFVEDQHSAIITGQAQ
jgi:pimeloyl-ACP methyl ester carboxylesterase